MRQRFGLIIATLARAAMVSSTIGPYFITRLSLPPHFMTPRGFLSDMHSHKQPGPLSDIRFVSTLSFQIIAHAQNQNKPPVALVLVIR